MIALNRIIRAGVLAVPLIFGCAHESPVELSTARAALARAHEAGAANLAPAAFAEARVALADAEAWAKAAPRDPWTADLAYVALRRSMRAEVLARRRAVPTQLVLSGGSP